MQDTMLSDVNRKRQHTMFVLKELMRDFKRHINKQYLWY